MSANLNPRHWKECLWVTVKETTDTWCTYPTHRSGLNPGQHRDAQPTRWGVTATGDLAHKWWSSRLWQQREAGHIYCNTGGVAWRREREHSRNETETRCLGCWGSSTRWRMYCSRRDSQRLGVAGRQWQRGLYSQLVGFFEEVLEQEDRAEPRRRTRARNVPHFFWRSQDPSCYDWGWLCGTQNSQRSQARWWLGTVAPGNVGRGQSTPRQRELDLVRPPTDRDVLVKNAFYSACKNP